MIKLALRNLLRKKRRTILIGLALMLAVTVVLFTRFLSYGMHQETLWNTVSLHSGYIQIAANGSLDNPGLERAMEVSSKLLEAIQKTRGVKNISLRIESFALASFGENTRFIKVMGADPKTEKHITTLSNKIKQGRMFREGEFHIDKQGRKIYRAVPGNLVANSLNLKVGDVFSLVTSEFDGSIGAVLVKVSGIYKAGENQLDAYSLRISLGAAKELFGTVREGKEYYTSIAIEPGDRNRVPELTERLKEKFPLPKLKKGEDRAHSENFNPVAYGWRELVPGVIQLIDLDQVGTEVSLFFIIFIMSFGVLNVVQMAIHERRREFGVLKALGTSPGRLYGTFLLEILFLMLPAFALGALLGVFAGNYMEHNPVLITGEDAKIFLEMGFVPVIRSKVALSEMWIGLVSIFVPVALFTVIAAHRIFRLVPVQEIAER